ncbi:hypothetical protein Tco_1192514 [Tanacetum coccineum]
MCVPGRLRTNFQSKINSGYRPPMVSNQIRPPGFPPVQNPHANSQNNFNRGNNFNQNRGNNFNQASTTSVSWNSSFVFFALEDDPTSSEVDPTYQDTEGDILILEAILNSEPPPPLPNHEQYMPGGRKELKLCEAKTVEPSINEPPEVELKELPPPPSTNTAILEGK